MTELSNKPLEWAGDLPPKNWSTGDESRLGYDARREGGA